MYLITNRKISKASGLKCLGSSPNIKGPNELRLVKVNKLAKEWEVTPLDDQLSTKRVNELNEHYHLELDLKKEWYGSLEVACELFQKARKEKKSILFFAHGYNNDVSDILETAFEIECLYNVIVVPFTWPANGGGVISGAAAYLSDKSDARASAGAFNRAIGIIQRLHLLLTESLQKNHLHTAFEKHPTNPNEAAALFTKLIETDCNIKINLLCHSMGNYLLKHTFCSSENNTSQLVFDNVLLIAADTNNEDHSNWVNKLDVRKRVYIVINENDSALRVSRIKPGEEQKARLGHYLNKLNSENALYIDLTDAQYVDSQHSYFKGNTVKKNEELKVLFKMMFSGESVEHLLSYQVDKNTYKP